MFVYFTYEGVSGDGETTDGAEKYAADERRRLWEDL